MKWFSLLTILPTAGLAFQPQAQPVITQRTSQLYSVLPQRFDRVCYVEVAVLFVVNTIVSGSLYYSYFIPLSHIIIRLKNVLSTTIVAMSGSSKN